MEVERSMLGLLAAKPLVEHAGFLLVVMIAYLLLMLLLGYIAGRKTTDNSDDYMAAEGKMPFWLVTATILATFICGATIMGGGGVAYSDGFPATIADPFAACLCLIAGTLYRFHKVAPWGTLAQSHCPLPHHHLLGSGYHTNIGTTRLGRNTA